MCMSLSRLCERCPGAEEGNPHCGTGEERRPRGLARGERTFYLLNLWLSERGSCSIVQRLQTARSRESISSMTVQDTPVVLEDGVKLQVARKHQKDRAD